MISRHVVAASLAAMLLSACAGLPSSPAPSTVAAATPLSRPASSPVPAAASVFAAASPASAPSGARPAAATPSPAPPPGSPPPFAVVIKDAKKTDGPLVVWQKDDKVWIELAPANLGQPFLLSPKIKSGIGEAFVLGGLMAFPVSGAGGVQVVEFVRVHNTVRLQARNVEVLAKPGTPEARAVESTYSASLLGSTPVASLPHPETKSILIEANGLFLSDMLGVGMQLQRAFRQGYSLDRANTTITAVRASPQAVVIETLNHYFTPTLATAQPGLPPGAPAPTLPRFIPDTRSMLVGHHYSLAPLPPQPMAPRRADARVGLISTTVFDFSDDLARTPRQRMIHRWRLEKKEPAAEVSDPAKPITFWIDRNVPLQYRDTVRAAILEWNKAFERIGFSNAIVVQQQADDADFDTLDFGYSSVRWMMSAAPGFTAIGPSHVDPRSGEILAADIAFEGLYARLQRTVRSQVLPTTFAGSSAIDSLEFCRFGEVAAQQAAYGLEVLQARGDIEPDSQEAQQFVLEYLKDTIMHEVGHALGLRHNFRASRAYTEAQLSDAEFTRANGTTGSVMEYNAVNLPRPGERGGTPFQLTLGPYDYWAIEYAYKPMAPGSSRADEEAELQRVAARSSEPLLAYGSDEDSALGIDPETLPWDLGADPIAFAAKRLEIARDVFKRQEARELRPDRDYAVLRRSIGYALGDATIAVGTLVRQIGGLRTLRDHPGSGRDPLQPVDAGVQRQALDLIAHAVFTADGLSLSPALQRRLAPDFQDRADGAAPTDFVPAQRLLDLQRAVLGYLMSDAVAARILDGVTKIDRPAQAFQLAELYSRLARDLWSELAQRTSISGPRRELQREHLNLLAAALLRPSGLSGLSGPSGQGRAEARSLLRQQAKQLLVRLESLGRRGSGMDEESRAHLRDGADALRLALAARIVKGAV